MQCTPRRQLRLIPLLRSPYSLPLSSSRLRVFTQPHAIPDVSRRLAPVGRHDVCCRIVLENSLATRASGPHSFPFRTRSLSPTAPMVLRPRGRGRVGRRRHLLTKSPITVCGRGLCCFRKYSRKRPTVRRPPPVLHSSRQIHVVVAMAHRSMPTHSANSMKRTLGHQSVARFHQGQGVSMLYLRQRECHAAAPLNGLHHVNQAYADIARIDRQSAGTEM